MIYFFIRSHVMCKQCCLELVLADSLQNAFCVNQGEYLNYDIFLNKKTVLIHRKHNSK